uniref:Uncharacterized protein n=1 Tax=viral metagenome TaxID=1070528 RepID=A0A6M3MBI8_9ZZZZ
MIKVLTYLLPGLLKVLRPEVLKKSVDAMLDVIEDSVEKSANKVDDIVVLPLCALIRRTFDVPDND